MENSGTFQEMVYRYYVLVNKNISVFWSGESGWVGGVGEWAAVVVVGGNCSIMQQRESFWCVAAFTDAI